MKKPIKNRKPRKNLLHHRNQQIEMFNSEKPMNMGDIQNGLCEALGFPGGAYAANQPTGWIGNMPFPGQGGFPGGFSIQQVSDSTTMFENLRWYYVSNFRQLLSELYVEIGLIKTIVDVPVDDGLRGGISLLSKQLSEDQIRELQISLDRDDDLNTAGWACKWNRLYGGAGILILTDDQDPIDPFDINAIGPDTGLEFRAVDMWELFWDKQNTEGYDPQIQAQDFEFYEYYSELIHKSRVMRFKGTMAPSFTRPFFRGWGVSCVEQLIRSCNQYLKAVDLAFEVLDEFKIDVYRMKNLINTLLTPSGQTSVQQRIQVANWNKNYQNAIVLDSEDEFQQKQLSFAGLGDYMEQVRMQIAADMRMPITKLFGTSVSKGFQTDQNDMENYNSMVEAEIRNKLKYDILRMCEIKCQKLFGFIPDDLELEWKPLRELTAMDQENVRTAKYNRASDAYKSGLISAEQFAEIANKAQFFDIKIESGDGIIAELENPDQAEITSEENHDPNADLDLNDPGANREDTRRVEADVTVEGRTPMMSPASRPKLPETSSEVNEERLQMKREKQGKQALVKATKNARKEFEVDRASLSKFRKDYEKSHPTSRRSPLYNDEWADQAEGKIPGASGISTEAMEDHDQKIRNPGDVDEAKWAKAKKLCEKEYGHIKWPVVSKIYKSLGGEFHKGE